MKHVKKFEASIDQSIKSVKEYNDIISKLDDMQSDLDDFVDEFQQLIYDSKQLLDDDNGLKLEVRDELESRLTEIRYKLIGMIDQL